jgi:hypothetical protein
MIVGRGTALERGRIDLEATHILDGKPLIQRTDAVGRTYYTGLNKIRVGTTGREGDIKPITDADRIPAEEAILPAASAEEAVQDLEEDGLTEFTFTAFAVAIAAILAGHGYAERGGVCANRCGDRSAIVSLPHPGGGSSRHRLDFPETMRLSAEVSE